MEQELAEPKLQSPHPEECHELVNSNMRLMHPLVQGNELDKLPEDLYIPPDALLVFLEAFEGPLDLLLYLIRKNNLDILNIPIAKITMQYMEYVEIMKVVHLELAAEYLVMAAMLAEIKSRMLLPRSNELVQDESDPRAELMRRLQEYEQIKLAAEQIGVMPILGRDYFLGTADLPNYETKIRPPTVDVKWLVLAFSEILRRTEALTSHKIQKEPLSVRERMTRILALLQEKPYIVFENCFYLAEGRMGVIVTFIAILELVKEQIIDIIQTESFGPIHLKVNENDKNCE